MATLLMIDDEPAIGTLIRRVGETCGYRVIDVSNAPAFKRELVATNPDLIALDLTMPDTDGIELLRFLAISRWRWRPSHQTGRAGSFASELHSC